MKKLIKIFFTLLIFTLIIGFSAYFYITKSSFQTKKINQYFSENNIPAKVLDAKIGLTGLKFQELEFLIGQDDNNYSVKMNKMYCSFSLLKFIFCKEIFLENVKAENVEILDIKNEEKSATDTLLSDVKDKIKKEGENFSNSTNNDIASENFKEKQKTNTQNLQNGIKNTKSENFKFDYKINISNLSLENLSYKENLQLNIKAKDILFAKNLDLKSFNISSIAKIDKDLNINLGISLKNKKDLDLKLSDNSSFEISAENIFVDFKKLLFKGEINLSLSSDIQKYAFLKQTKYLSILNEDNLSCKLRFNCDFINKKSELSATTKFAINSKFEDINKPSFQINFATKFDRQLISLENLKVEILANQDLSSNNFLVLSLMQKIDIKIDNLLNIKNLESLNDFYTFAFDKLEGEIFSLKAENISSLIINAITRKEYFCDFLISADASICKKDNDIVFMGDFLSDKNFNLAIQTNFDFKENSSESFINLFLKKDIFSLSEFPSMRNLPDNTNFKLTTKVNTKNNFNFIQIPSGNFEIYLEDNNSYIARAELLKKIDISIFDFSSNLNAINGNIAKTSFDRFPMDLVSKFINNIDFDSGFLSGQIDLKLDKSNITASSNGLDLEDFSLKVGQKDIFENLSYKSKKISYDFNFSDNSMEALSEEFMVRKRKNVLFFGNLDFALSDKMTISGSCENANLAALCAIEILDNKSLSSGLFKSEYFFMQMQNENIKVSLKNSHLWDISSPYCDYRCKYMNISKLDYAKEKENISVNSNLFFKSNFVKNDIDIDLNLEGQNYQIKSSSNNLDIKDVKDTLDLFTKIFAKEKSVNSAIDTKNQTEALSSNVANNTSTRKLKNTTIPSLQEQEKLSFENVAKESANYFNSLDKFLFPQNGKAFWDFGKKINAEIKIGNIYNNCIALLKGVDFEAFVNDKKLDYDLEVSSFADGSFSNKVNVSFNNKKAYDLSDFDIDVKSVDFQDLLKILGVKSDVLTGQINLQSKLNSSGKSSKELLSFLQGNFLLNAHSGNVQVIKASTSDNKLASAGANAFELMTGILSKVAGTKIKEISMVDDLLKNLKNLNYNQIILEVNRNSLEDIEISKINLLSEDILIIGQGHIDFDEEVLWKNWNINSQLMLLAKENSNVAKTLDYAGLLKTESTINNYIQGPIFYIGGTLSNMQNNLSQIINKAISGASSRALGSAFSE